MTRFEKHAANKKRQAWRFGRFAEALCAWHLRLKGYRILERSFRVYVGEIDIIARRGDIIAMIEVKARSNISDAAQALGRRQRQRIARAAGAFIQSNPDCANLDMRFDVMLVSPWRAPIHLADAWRSES